VVAANDAHVTPGGMSLARYRAVLFGDVDNYVDEAGRPIGEIRADPRVRALAATTYRACPYPGSRRKSGRPMNVSALRQVGRNWDLVLGLIGLLGRTIRKSGGNADTRSMALLDVARAAHTGLQLPGYLMFRSDAPMEDSGVPVFVAAAHKVLAGVFGLAKNALIWRVANGDPYEAVIADPTWLANFAESSGLLVGRSGTEVCAGSPDMLADVLEAIVAGLALTDAQERLIGLGVDVDALLGYADAVADAVLWSIAFAVRARSLVRELRRDAVTAADVRHGPLYDAFEQLGVGARATAAIRLVDTSAGDAMIGGVRALLRTVPIEARSGPIFGVAKNPRVNTEDVDRLHSWIEGGVIQAAAEGTTRSTIQALVKCLHIECDARRLFEGIQARAWSCLGQTEPPFVEPRRLAAVCGLPPSAVFEASLGVSINWTPHGALISRGDRRFEISIMPLDQSLPVHSSPI
jgi:hypothetical protein